MSALSLQSEPSWKTVAVAVPLVAVAAMLGGMLAARLTLAPPAFGGPALTAPETVTIAPRRFEYRLPGEFYRNGHEVDAPLETVTATKPLTIMKYQVSAARYALCMAEGACSAADRTPPAGTDPDTIPATGVNFDDAQAYAQWFSRRSGESWRLPTDAELAFAAGRRFPDDALGLGDEGNPALRWLADYRREAALKATRQPVPQPFGHFGENEFGLADFGGNVWEWTATCNRQVRLDAAGRPGAGEANCGIYITAGRHRAPMSSFIRDPKGGGCSVGTPPDNLGFRLVRETPWHQRLLHRLGLS